MAEVTSEVLIGTGVVAVSLGGAYLLGRFITNRNSKKAMETALDDYAEKVSDQMEEQMLRIHKLESENASMEEKLVDKQVMINDIQTLMEELKANNKTLSTEKSRWEGYDDKFRDLQEKARQAQIEARTAKGQVTRLKKKLEVDASA